MVRINVHQDVIVILFKNPKLCLLMFVAWNVWRIGAFKSPIKELNMSNDSSLILELLLVLWCNKVGGEHEKVPPSVVPCLRIVFECEQQKPDSLIVVVLLCS
jgi:hypothetical protein